MPGRGTLIGKQRKMARAGCCGSTQHPTAVRHGRWPGGWQHLGGDGRCLGTS